MGKGRRSSNLMGWGVGNVLFRKGSTKQRGTEDEEREKVRNLWETRERERERERERVNLKLRWKSKD